MKKTKTAPTPYLLALCLLTMISCTKDSTPKDPVDTLPPITQTGEDTFACLINGKPFFSSYKRRATYSGSSISISGSRRDDLGLRTVSVQGIDVEPVIKGTYLLESEVSGNFSGLYGIGGGLVLDAVSADASPGLLTITRFDLDEFIVSGTFEFTAISEQGEEYHITHGRFDLRF